MLLEGFAREPGCHTGHSHLILGTGSARRTITNQLTKLCCILALYKALENLDAIALTFSPSINCNSVLILKGLRSTGTSGRFVSTYSISCWLPAEIMMAGS